MRANLPVTGREYEFPDHATLMSTTDIHSHITYANAAFQQVSGFEREDILGQPHNMVRHPDMPPEAFQDMWNTLRRGEPWTALVKNRRKDGDHYWVRANATPVARDGRTVGYMSVRTKPSRGEVQAAEALYRNFREGRAAGLAFHKGLIVRKGWRAWMSLPQTLPLRWRLRGALAGVALFVPGCLLALGLGGAVVAMAAATAAVGALLACLLLEQQVSRPMEAVLAQALQVASGQTDSVQMNRVDEIGMTLRSINQLGLMFRWIIDDVSDQVVNVQVATDEISQGNTDLSVRTEQAASSLQQTASSMTEMTATIRTNADTALQASQLASSATLAAAQGGQAVAEVVSTMHDISARSSKISEIIGVIDGIAFQTNILALNAAVEAARAGEQGRGFAVVAGEVRSLARRSAEAAREIKALIGASVEKVDSGSRLVDEAGRAMEGIVTQVRSVSQLIGEISAATQEQSAGIEQVGGAVTQLDEVTQQNAALVEQSASASESLRQQADRLVEAVSVFRNA